MLVSLNIRRTILISKYVTWEKTPYEKYFGLTLRPPQQIYILKSYLLNRFFKKNLFTNIFL